MATYEPFVGTPPADQEVRLYLQHCIGFRPVTGSSGVGDVMALASSILMDRGLRKETFHGTRGDVICLSHRPPGASVTVGIVLHCDVVDAGNPEQWNLVERNGRYYGRGVADMLGQLVEVVLVLRRHAKRAEVAFDVILTPNEELGPRMFGEYAKAKHLDYDFVWTPEPTTGISLESRGQWNPSLHFRGIPAHGSRPSMGLNAIDLFRMFMAEADQLRFLRPLSRIPRLRPRRRLPLLHAHSPYPEDATFTATVIEGGQSFSVLAGTTDVEVDCRFVHGHDPDVIMREVHELARRFNSRIRRDVARRIAVAEIGVSIDDLGVTVRDGEWVQPIWIARNHPAIRTLRDVMVERGCDERDLFTVQHGGTEVGLVPERSIRAQAFEWAPGKDQHTPHESIGIGELRTFGADVNNWFDRLPAAYLQH